MNTDDGWGCMGGLLAIGGLVVLLAVLGLAFFAVSAGGMLLWKLIA